MTALARRGLATPGQPPVPTTAIDRLQATSHISEAQVRIEALMSASCRVLLGDLSIESLGDVVRLASHANRHLLAAS